MNTPLPTTPLGRTGMQLTRVGFGAWAIGGGDWAFAWGNQDDAASSRPSGTRSSPGSTGSTPPPSTGSATPRRSSRRRWRACPRPTGPTSSPRAAWSGIRPTGRRRPRRVGAPASLRAEVEASLRRLRVERIDLYQMHWPRRGRHPGRGVLAGLHRPQARGQDPRGRAVQPRHLPAGGGRGGRRGGRHPAAVQPDPPRRGRRRPAVGARARGRARSSTARWPRACSPARSPPSGRPRLQPGDWRAGHPDFTEPALSANLALADALRPVAERHGVTPAAVAVAWTLAFPGVTGAIVGARSPEQVDGWLPAATPGAQGRRPGRHRRRHPRDRRRDRARQPAPLTTDDGGQWRPDGTTTRPFGMKRLLNLKALDFPERSGVLDRAEHEAVVRDAADLAAALVRESGDIDARLVREFSADDRGDARGGRPRSRVPPYCLADHASRDRVGEQQRRPETGCLGQ